MTSLGPATARQKTNWIGVLARELRGVGELFSDFLARKAFREQVADLDRRGGLDDILDVLGISRPSLEGIIRGYPESGRLLPAMTQRLGVDVDKLDPIARYELGRTCAVCRSHRRCRRWLSTARPESPEYRAFCPNVELLDAALAKDRQV